MTKLLALLLLTSLPWQAAHAEHGHHAAAPSIVVTGQGSAQLKPDMALLTLSVQQQAPTAREAVTATSAAMEKVLVALKAKGIAERDLQTADFSIHPQYRHEHRPNQPDTGPQLIGYLVRNSLNVRVRDIKSVGELLDTAVSLGVNEGGQIAFTNDDPSAALKDARTRAVRDATARAKTLAEAAGVKLGAVLEISEQSFESRPMPMMRAEMTFAADAAKSVPVATGENTYQVTVNMRFGIAQ